MIKEKSVTEVTLDGRLVCIHEFGAIQGWRIMRKIMSVVGPVMAEFTSGEEAIPRAIMVLFDRLPEEDLINLLKALTENCTIDGRRVGFERDLGVNKFTIDLLTEVVKANFDEFFTLVQEKLGGFLGEMEA